MWHKISIIIKVSHRDESIAENIVYNNNNFIMVNKLINNKILLFLFTEHFLHARLCSKDLVSFYLHMMSVRQILSLLSRSEQQSS